MEKRGSRPYIGEEPEGGEHADHQEFAVGEIDDIHDAPDEGEPDGDQGIHETDQ